MNRGAYPTSSPNQTPLAILFRETDQSIPNSTTTLVAFSKALADNAGMTNIPLRPTKIIVPEAGKYTIAVSGFWPPSGAGVRQLGVNLNGVQNNTLGQSAPSSGRAWMAFSYITLLRAGDVLEMWAFQTSGGPLNLLSSLPLYATQFSPCLTIKKEMN